MTRPAVVLVAVILSLGCGGLDEPAIDAGPGDGGGIDAQVDGAAGGSDGGSHDSGSADGGSSDAGSSGGSDGGSRDGGFVDAGSSCGPTLGLPCTDSCAAGFVCVQERCVPDRAGCGGFAGDPCADPDRYCCSYPRGSSAAICVTPAESACLEFRASGEFGLCTLRR